MTIDATPAAILRLAMEALAAAETPAAIKAALVEALTVPGQLARIGAVFGALKGGAGTLTGPAFEAVMSAAAYLGPPNNLLGLGEEAAVVAAHAGRLDGKPPQS
jgi:hypothetical protein